MLFMITPQPLYSTLGNTRNSLRVSPTFQRFIHANKPQTSGHNNIPFLGVCSFLSKLSFQMNPSSLPTLISRLVTLTTPTHYMQQSACQKPTPYKVFSKPVHAVRARVTHNCGSLREAVARKLTEETKQVWFLSQLTISALNSPPKLQIDCYGILGYIFRGDSEENAQMLSM